MQLALTLDLFPFIFSISVSIELFVSNCQKIVFLCLAAENAMNCSRNPGVCICVFPLWCETGHLCVF